MLIENQQTLAKSGAANRPPILEKGRYVPWASLFLRFLDNKQGEGELMRNSIDNGPYKRKEIAYPNDDTKKILEPINKLSQQNQNQYYAYIKNQKIDSRFSTLINVMDQNKVTSLEISINTKFLNSLQPEWSKYVTLCRQKYILEEAHFDVFYDYMSQFEPHVKASKAKKAARNHDPLDLVANLQASSLYSCSTQPYHVIHPSSVIDNA
ncbi:hypothetical protein Tco_0627720 [Tanacetum coccineum]|uniref:Uncharacterized protein n=1 Tax=Tanacetum coccineum TaxID=301880 RepID=A0ABQ4WNC4_9ASTR